MARRRKGRARVRNVGSGEEPESVRRAPHSFVIHRGLVGRYVKFLTRDFRKVMEPYTASQLVMRKKNTLKDLVAVGGLLNVSHLVMFTHSELSVYMRIATLPQGPTLTFRVDSYTLSKDVAASLKKQISHKNYYMESPLVVLNGFSGEGAQMKLMTATFQAMFPTINITKVDLNKVKRCVLLSYSEETKSIEMRHYGIRVVPVGLSKPVNKLLKGKVPNLANYKDVADYLIRGGDVSESEWEDDEASQVTLPQRIASRGNITHSKSSIKVTEIGPRLRMQLVKVEGGLLDGEVIFHEYIKKTKEELAIILKRREERRKTKEKRQKMQEMNVQKKEELRGELSKRKERERGSHQEQAQVEEDDDAQWYRTQVGEEPHPELFSNASKTGGGVKRKRDLLRWGGGKKKREDTGAEPRFKRAREGTGAKPHFKRTKEGTGAESRFKRTKEGTGAEPRFKRTREGTGAEPRFKRTREGTGAEPRFKKTREAPGAEPRFNNRSKSSPDKPRRRNANFASNTSKGGHNKRRVGTKVNKGRRY